LHGQVLAFIVVDADLGVCIVPVVEDEKRLVKVLAGCDWQLVRRLVEEHTP
jgi:hypothetical protein